MSHRFGNLSPAWVDRLERDADRFIAERAVPGLIMVPVVMIAFTCLTGSDSPFWKPAVGMTIGGVALAVPRMWLTVKARRLPETEAALPSRRAFAIATAGMPSPAASPPSWAAVAPESSTSRPR